MNGLIAALIAVLLAEIGDRAAIVRHDVRLMSLVSLALIILAAITGHVVAPSLNDRAVMLMIGIALAFAALAQRTAVSRPSSRTGRVAIAWSGGTPMLVAAFAAYFAAGPVAIGAGVGMAAAVMLTDITSGRPRLSHGVRAAAAGSLALASAVMVFQVLGVN